MAEPFSAEVRTSIKGVELPKVYQKSEINRMLGAQEQKGIRPTGLVSDFDNSYFRSDGVADTKKLAAITAEYDIPTTIVTGNDLATITKKMDDNGLRKPEVLITAVGTEIYVLQKDGIGREIYAKDDEYQKKMEEAQFDRKGCVVGLQKTILDWRDDITKKAHSLDFQKPEVEVAFQKGETVDVQDYKVSCYFMAENDQDRGFVELEIKKQFPHLEILICEEIGHNSKIKAGEPKKYCIDMLPIPKGLDHGGKAGAVDYLQKTIGLERAFNVGDSGNDIQMLHSTALGEGIIVGGAKPELRDTVADVANFTPIGNTGFVKGPTGKKFFEASSTGTQAAGSIIDAAIRRLRVTLRFETEPKMRDYIREIIGKLQAPTQPSLQAV
ncbi:MAG: HAD family hydrolase [Microgenomates group bacterium]